mmetsp:Transcript_12278/g.18477  ORF Transcript_12278/g.18477 Transcript_12278/m.18477 type:complete len:202 (+) Transcript_12278:1453-2058(+)
MVKIGYGYSFWDQHPFTLNLYHEMNIKHTSIVRGIVQILQRRGILSHTRRRGTTKWLQGLQCHHPRRYTCCKILTSKRAERNIFPLLYIPRAPIIHKAESKYVIICLLHRYNLTVFTRTSTNKKCNFQLKIQHSTRPVDRSTLWICHILLQLSIGSNDIRAAHKYGGSASVIADRQMQPVRIQCMLFPTKHYAYVRRVVLR